MSCIASKIRRKACGRWWKNASRSGRIAEQFAGNARDDAIHNAISLTPFRVRHTLNFQFAGMGSGEGREIRPRSRHCKRLQGRKPGYPPMPQRLRALREKGRCQTPRCLVGFFFA